MNQNLSLLVHEPGHFMEQQRRVTTLLLLFSADQQVMTGEHLVAHHFLCPIFYWKLLNTSCYEISYFALLFSIFPFPPPLQMRDGSNKYILLEILEQCSFCS